LVEVFFLKDLIWMLWRERLLNATGVLINLKEN